jgi:hypothetical protein
MVFPRRRIISLDDTAGAKPKLVWVRQIELLIGRAPDL